jgi:hypothetical protein
MKQSSSARKNRYLNEAFENLEMFLFCFQKRKEWYRGLRLL